MDVSDRLAKQQIERALIDLGEQHGIHLKPGAGASTLEAREVDVREVLAHVLTELFSDEGIARAVDSHAANAHRSPEERMVLAIAAALQGEEFVTLTDE